MKNTRIPALTPFLLTDGLLAIIALLLLRLDMIVNTTLYEYGLRFDANWATPYWTTIRTALAMIAIAMMLVPTLGYITQNHNPIQTNKTTVYVCKTCNTAWSTINEISKINGKPPPLTHIKTCAQCNKQLLDWMMNPQITPTPTPKQKTTPQY